MREAVTETLGGPQPELSNRISKFVEDNGNDWSGIAHRLWQNVRYIKCVSTGIMKQYYPKVKYYAGEVPVVGGDYFASECSVGLNLDIMQPPETTRYVLFPNTAYFEFLPFNMNDETNNNVADEMFDHSSVEVRKMYEIVVTTYGGFYRYRLGDVVRILGFYNSSPEVEFVMRAPKAASEILTERDLISAIDNFQLSLRGAMMRTQIVEFASFLDQESRPKQLKVFVEVQEESDFMEDKQEESIRTLRSCITSLEGSLGALYKVEKVKGQLGN
ncbi:probable indole-3-acetic acid-amido synthetase GH3.6 [Arachis ipaensis]|uniref:probable indole-3-acetic acid-amido synthetase GH3.6 n=1 Tax=Arachis ipaensis TaxID=130454 RepID=UPI000A2B49C2|nr:probable indole-3-acetic acid-amido synthetase GH3.6 [Arachis ipaensis]